MDPKATNGGFPEPTTLCREVRDINANMPEGLMLNVCLAMFRLLSTTKAQDHSRIEVRFRFEGNSVSRRMLTCAPAYTCNLERQPRPGLRLSQLQAATLGTSRPIHGRISIRMQQAEFPAFWLDSIYAGALGLEKGHEIAREGSPVAPEHLW